MVNDQGCQGFTEPVSPPFDIKSIFQRRIGLIIQRYWLFAKKTNKLSSYFHMYGRNHRLFYHFRNGFGYPFLKLNFLKKLFFVFIIVFLYAYYTIISFFDKQFFLHTSS